MMFMSALPLPTVAARYASFDYKGRRQHPFQYPGRLRAELFKIDTDQRRFFHIYGKRWSPQEKCHQRAAQGLMARQQGGAFIRTGADLVPNSWRRSIGLERAGADDLSLVPKHANRFIGCLDGAPVGTAQDE